jgi:hypothetical protein
MDGQALAISPPQFYDVHQTREFVSSSADLRHWDATAPDCASMLRDMHRTFGAPLGRCGIGDRAFTDSREWHDCETP